MDKECELINDTVDVCDVKKDDLEGFVDNGDTLIQYGHIRVLHDSCIRDTAKIYGNALVCDKFGEW